MSDTGSQVSATCANCVSAARVRIGQTYGYNFNGGFSRRTIPPREQARLLLAARGAFRANTVNKPSATVPGVLNVYAYVGRNEPYYGIDDS